MKPATQRYVCIAVGWILLVGYSILITAAVEGLIDRSNMVVFEDDRIKPIITFLYGLAVVSFLGGSQIPAVFLKKKSFIIQFGFSAAFGLMLLILTLLNPLSSTIKPFFYDYPVIALEYLSIPYFFMIFIDLYSNKRLDAFSWRRWSQYLYRIFLHPRSTFEDVIYRRSTLFSLVAVALVSTVWTVRTIAFSGTDFAPMRWNFIPFNVGGSLEPVSKTVLIAPSMFLLWLATSVFVHVAGRRLGGNNSYSDTVSLLGFVFLPSLIAVITDFFEFILHPSKSSLLLGWGFLILDFVIPLLLWPLILSIFAIQTSEDLSSRSASLLATVLFLPLFLLLTLIFL